MSGEPRRIAIGITTFKRPRMLEKALRALEKLETEDDVFVLVADNDALGQEGLAVVEKVAASRFRFPISAVLIEPRGFTYGRNALLKAAFFEADASLLAVMDDDQIPDSRWLSAMLKVQDEADADVVGPAVWPAFEEEPPRWVTTSKVYRRDVTTTGTVDILHGDGGVLLARRLTRLLPLPWYDHSFALTGGADAELFRRLRVLGARFARSHEAVIHESYPPSRMRLHWALSRAYRIGNNAIQIGLRHEPMARLIAIEAVKIAGTLSVVPVLLLLSLGRVGQQVDVLCLVARACGKLAALLGTRYLEYSRTHGS